MSTARPELSLSQRVRLNLAYLQINLDAQTGMSPKFELPLDTLEQLQESGAVEETSRNLKRFSQDLARFLQGMFLDVSLPALNLTPVQYGIFEKFQSSSTFDNIAVDVIHLPKKGPFVSSLYADSSQEACCLICWNISTNLPETLFFFPDKSDKEENHGVICLIFPDRPSQEDIISNLATFPVHGVVEVNPVRELARGIGPRARIESPNPAASRGAFSNGVNTIDPGGTGFDVRITRNTVTKVQIASLMRFFLLGSFNSSSSDRTFYLYAHNPLTKRVEIYL